jgi:hypothetical protein
MIHAHYDRGTHFELGLATHARPHVADFVHSETIDDPTELTVAEIAEQVGDAELYERVAPELLRFATLLSGGSTLLTSCRTPW